ncbi:MAG: sulfotransferase [Mycobacterium sp.]|nr:sulfotransferase [Mycobacterium sp.]
MTRVFFIGGFGRSGSTLLERVLAAATDSCALGEVVFLWERGVLRDDHCACGARFSQCTFWRAVGEEAFGGWRRLDAEAMAAMRRATDRTRNIPGLLLGRNAHRRSQSYAELFAEVYAAALRVSGASMVIDSSKHASTAFNLRQHPRLDLRVAVVVRDSRGVAYSWTKSRQHASIGGATSGDTEMYSYTPWRSALLWDAQNAAFGFLRTAGVSSYMLRYEDFLRAPVQKLSALAQFAGVECRPERVFLDQRTVQLGISHQISGNPMRHNSGAISLREDDTWRDRMPRRSKMTVSVLTAPLLASYGYFGARSK